MQKTFGTRKQVVHRLLEDSNHHHALKLQELTKASPTLLRTGDVGFSEETKGQINAMSVAMIQGMDRNPLLRANKLVFKEAPSRAQGSQGLSAFGEPIMTNLAI